MNLTSLKTLASAIAPLAPTLATMLGGPLAGTAVAALEGAFGLTAGSGPEAITQVLQSGSATAQQLAAVREADQHHAEVIGEQKLDMAKLNAAHAEAFAALEEQDRASARGRETVVRDWIPGFLAVGVTVGFFGILAYVMHFGLRQIGTGQGGEAVVLMLGSLGTAWTGMIGYYFGSSSSAQKNAETIAQIAKS